MTLATVSSEDEVGAIIARHLHLEGPLLPILHALQDALGCIPTTADDQIVSALNISKAELHGVISFYHDFRREPVKGRVIKICQAEACQAVGAFDLGQTAREKLGRDWGQPSEHGGVTLEPVYCLGLCACGPAVLTDDQVIGRVDEERLLQLLAESGS